MRKWCAVFLAAWAVGCGAALAGEAKLSADAACKMLAALPATATGTFVQRKTLADVDVTITSSGTFRFVKDESFEWNTLKPLPSTFTATRDSYTVTANGKTSTRKLSELKLSAGMRMLVKGDMSGLEETFNATDKDGRLTFTPKTKELREFVKRFTLEGKEFPSRFVLEYVNGDRLEIDLVQNR